MTPTPTKTRLRHATPSLLVDKANRSYIKAVRQ